MKKSLFEQIGGTYTQQGDYILPNLILSAEEGKQYIGLWGQRHARYLKQHNRILYYNLLTSGKLNAHLTEIDRQAEEMFSRLVKQMAEREGVTEQLKAENQMEWARRMNNIRNAAIEYVNNKIICL
ncbi:TnpV protein [Phocea massiliensis]|uniref:TnpV protein n=1 Tax=Merdimmobilis hominis TaxID=2897707 RepID=A0A938X664_9FIRM|nr:TnpV protein [Merdimmobilis hominis]MBM6920643.1 TnpV protein [Merdimmobilis hominis]